jgi:hypothetical protein
LGAQEKGCLGSRIERKNSISRSMLPKEIKEEPGESQQGAEH